MLQFTAIIFLKSAQGKNYKNYAEVGRNEAPLEESFWNI